MVAPFTPSKALRWAQATSRAQTRVHTQTGARKGRCQSCLARTWRRATTWPRRVPCRAMRRTRSRGRRGGAFSPARLSIRALQARTRPEELT